MTNTIVRKNFTHKISFTVYVVFALEQGQDFLALFLSADTRELEITQELEIPRESHIVTGFMVFTRNCLYSRLVKGSAQPRNGHNNLDGGFHHKKDSIGFASMFRSEPRNGLCIQGGGQL